MIGLRALQVPGGQVGLQASSSRENPDCSLDTAEAAWRPPGWERSRCLSGGGAGRRSPRLAVGPVSMLGWRTLASGASCCRTSAATLR